MIHRALLFTAAYAIVYLGTARLLSTTEVSEGTSFWVSFTAATLLTVFFCRSAHSFWLAPLAYLFLFFVDFIFEWRWITTPQTESMFTAIPATLIFVLPLAIGFGASKLTRRAYAS